MEKVPYLGATLRRWRVGNSTFLALPEQGARLMNWNITLGDGSVRDVIYWPEMSSMENFATVRGGNPILFPFSARCFDHGDIFFWRDPAGVRRPMPIHGLARQGAFKVTRIDAGGFSAQFEPGEEARASYPFDYEFTVAYRFDPLGLNCEYTLQNFGDQPLPWSAGHHFYFTLPWSEEASRKDYWLRIPAGRHLRQDRQNGKLDPGPELAPEENMANPELIETFHTSLKDGEAFLREQGRPGGISVRIGEQKPPPADATFVTWTESPEARFYCVEPWMGPANAPENKAGLHWVPPRGTGSFTVSVKVS